MIKIEQGYEYHVDAYIPHDGIQDVLNPSVHGGWEGELIQCSPNDMNTDMVTIIWRREKVLKTTPTTTSAGSSNDDSMAYKQALSAQSTRSV